ncbi:MAG: phosphoenolpyruvate--protein phosphotransferase [Alphaproteobacteria bacterium]|nr:phosphoenolpyruvate--protein phosphotransferase [Alphaproteobacteria bacterium]
MAQLERRGRGASDGTFYGAVIWLDRETVAPRMPGNAETERQDLERAILAATEDIASLIADCQGEAAEILAFQIAMLEDDALRAPALDAIASGQPADCAWSEALDAEIHGYEVSDDEYFRARAADLKDIRNRVLRRLSGAEGRRPGGSGVFVGEDMAPTDFLEIDWSHGGAIALWGGSPSSHVAMLARSRGIPMVVGLGLETAKDCKHAIVDGAQGLALFEPSEDDRDDYARKAETEAAIRQAESRFLFESARLKDGTLIQLLINVASVEELDHLDPRSCDGIGLMRSEFLFGDGSMLPDEEQQYRAYRRLLEWAGDRPVTVRTLDAGGDKPIRGLTPQGETNPFLGLRGIRLSLAHPDIFRTQLKALARAAPHGNMKVMIPMVTVAEELAAAGALFDDCVEALRSAGISASRPPLGIMVEVPAVAIAPECFSTAAFFSIGSNDLAQYVTAASRDAPAVGSLNDPGHPAMLKLIAGIAAYGREHAIPVSLCGDMASDLRYLPALIAAGLRSISVAPSRVARVKAALAEI